MPLTAFQKAVARILAKNRHQKSHLAGGAVINRGEASLRLSNDLNVFHDVAEGVGASAEVDAKFLLDAGFEVAWKIRSASLFRADVSRGEDHVRLDWTADS